MEKKEIMIKTTEEIKNISSDTITLDASLFSHRKAIAYIIDALTEEKKQIDKAILDKVNHEKVKTSLFYTIISDYMEFNSEEFIKENGEEFYNKYKTKPVHREQVRTK